MNYYKIKSSCTFYGFTEKSVQLAKEESKYSINIQSKDSQAIASLLKFVILHSEMCFVSPSLNESQDG